MTEYDSEYHITRDWNAPWQNALCYETDYKMRRDRIGTWLANLDVDTSGEGRAALLPLLRSSTRDAAGKMQIDRLALKQNTVE